MPYRLLEEGEVIKEGDEWYYPVDTANGMWIEVNALTLKENEVMGKGHFPHRRKIKEYKE